VACVPYSHVGKIEIVNKIVRVILRKSLDEIKDQKHWSKFIPLVMLKMNNVPARNTAPPFLLKRNHLAKQDFNHKNISKTNEKDVYEFITKKNHSNDN
jgi:hypothetical protein